MVNAQLAAKQLNNSTITVTQTNAENKQTNIKQTNRLATNPTLLNNQNNQTPSINRKIKSNPIHHTTTPSPISNPKT